MLNNVDFPVLGLPTKAILIVDVKILFDYNN
jgi:hypothetical protein